MHPTSRGAPRPETPFSRGEAKAGDLHTLVQLRKLLLNYPNRNKVLIATITDLPFKVPPRVTRSGPWSPLPRRLRQ